jgi:hypothetical protein
MRPRQSTCSSLYPLIIRRWTTQDRQERHRIHLQNAPAVNHSSAFMALLVVIGISVGFPHRVSAEEHHGTTTVDYSLLGDSATATIPLACLTDKTQCYLWAPLSPMLPAALLGNIKINHSDPQNWLGNCMKLAWFKDHYGNPDNFIWCDQNDGGDCPASGWIESSGDETARIDYLFFSLNKSLCSFNASDVGWWGNLWYYYIKPVSSNTDERPQLIWEEDIQRLCQQAKGATVPVHKTFQAYLHYSDGAQEKVGAAKSFTINLACAGCPALQPTAITLPDAQEGEPYYHKIPQPAGGIGPMSFYNLGVTAPEGLSLSSLGVLSGTPLRAGVYTFEVTVRDSCPYDQSPNVPGQAATFQVTLKVACRPFTPHPVTLPAANIWQSYSFDLTKLPGLWAADLGGSSAYGYGCPQFGVTNSSWPPVLHLDKNLIEGFATYWGTFTADLQVTDCCPFGRQGATIPTSILVNRTLSTVYLTTYPAGAGTVTITQYGTTCSSSYNDDPAHCAAGFSGGSKVDLHAQCAAATPLVTCQGVSWSGSYCQGTSPDCQFTIPANSDAPVWVQFIVQTHGTPHPPPGPPGPTGPGHGPSK